MSSLASTSATLAVFLVVLPTKQALLFVGGVIAMLLGVYLRWRLPHERMAAEEYTKDRRMTEDQARQRIQLLRFGGPAAVIVGLVLFALLLWEN